MIIGAGAIVRTAHLPAYARLGYPVAGLFDLRSDTAQVTAKLFGIDTVFATLDDACAVRGAVFDVAVPGDQILGVLCRLPAGAAVLIQKPMGEDIAAATRIRDACRARRLVAAVNFQLRFSPNMLALRQLIEERRLGEITDIEVRIVDRQPWEQWSFLAGAPRLEVLYHSIHYLDAIRWLAGEPDGVHCLALPHPAFDELQRHAQLDHPGLWRSPPLLADAQPHASPGRDAPRVVFQGRRDRRRGGGDARREPRLPDRLA